MKTSDNSREQYAILQVQKSDGGVERLVIPYSNERVLREFLAERSIVATGFFSRDEATRNTSLEIGTPLTPIHYLTVGCRRVRLLMARSFSCQFGPVGWLEAVNDAACTTLAALYNLQVRLMQTLRRFEPAV